MDEMKRAHEIDVAMREVAQRRDEALNTTPALSPARRTALTALVARQFPVEAALHEAAAKRDQALHQVPAKIPAAVESMLVRQLATVELKSDFGRTALWLSPLRWPLTAVLTVCCLITIALLGLGRWETSRSNARNVPRGPLLETIRLEAGMEPFARTIAIGPFNLNTNEPASLQAAFFANRRLRFSDGNDTSLGLRLDLPMTAVLMEDGLARTP
jgi:hypothetical protein